jgi:hypothetical protein
MAARGSLGRAFALAALGGLLAGCGTTARIAPTAQVPEAENFQRVTQKKMKASQHWGMIADDAVGQTLISLEKNNSLQGRALYVPSPPSDSAFSRGFRNFLITGMVNRGLPVATTPGGAVKVDYETQIVRHVSDRYDYQLGSLTTLVTGLSVARNLAQHAAKKTLAGLALGVVAAGDVAAAQYTGGPTHTEIIVTTSITADNRFLMRKTDVYYAEDSDGALYQEGMGGMARDWKVVGQ